MAVVAYVSGKGYFVKDKRGGKIIGGPYKKYSEARASAGDAQQPEQQRQKPVGASDRTGVSAQQREVINQGLTRYEEFKRTGKLPPPKDPGFAERESKARVAAELARYKQADAAFAARAGQKAVRVEPGKEYVRHVEGVRGLRGGERHEADVRVTPKEEEKAAKEQRKVSRDYVLRVKAEQAIKAKDPKWRKKRKKNAFGFWVDK